MKITASLLIIVGLIAGGGPSIPVDSWAAKAGPSCRQECTPARQVCRTECVYGYRSVRSDGRPGVCTPGLGRAPACVTKRVCLRRMRVCRWLPRRCRIVCTGARSQ